MARQAIVKRSKVDVEIGVPRRENAAVLPRVEADDLNGFPGDRETNFGLFVQFGTVVSAALVAQNVKSGSHGVTVD
jgi:hypothetical protein